MGINGILMNKVRRLSQLLVATCTLAAMPGAVCARLPSDPSAQSSRNLSQDPTQTPAEAATYADLVALAEASDMIVRVQIRRQTTLKPERAPGLLPGFARLYIEARTLSLIAGQRALGESLVYLSDVPLTAKGKPPKLKRREMVLFARRSQGGGTKKATAIQLAGRFGQLDYSFALEERLRPILSDLADGNVPPRITGVSDALAVPGTLVGESETQIFLGTDTGAPVSVSVLRRPGQRPAWGVSWGEIIDSSSRPPESQSLEWYRLACSLPDSLPGSANLARDPAARQLAARDYSFVIEALGPCGRSITEAL